MTEKRHWFPAKKYGWGWGFPIAWQGWAVLAGYFVLLFGGIPAIDPESAPAAYGIYATLLTLLLIAVCWKKGESPRWRWGEPRGTSRPGGGIQPGPGRPTAARTATGATGSGAPEGERTKPGDL